MTIKEYVAQLQEIVKKYPDAQMVYSIDEEGNGFDTVKMWPVPGHFDAENGEFKPRIYTHKQINAVCVN